MITLQGPIKCEVKESPGKGMGVFATELIKQDEIIEECHLTVLPIPDCYQQILDDYRYNYPAGRVDYEDMVIVFGFGSIYNHSNEYNAYWVDHPECKAFRYIASKDIHPGEEIYIFYGNMHFN